MDTYDCRDQSIMDCTNQGRASRAEMAGNSKNLTTLKILLALYVFCGLITFACLALIVLWIKKRDYFPIRERSPYLVILFILGVFLHEISQPAALIYTIKTQTIPLNGIGWDQLNDMSRLLSNAYFLGVSLMICSYFMR